MELTSYKEAQTVAKETDKKLTAYDFNPYSMVEIIHEEGTILHYKSAFTKEWKDWVFVFTEHHGTHVYHISDLKDYGTYIRKDQEKLKDTGYVDTCEFCNKQFKVEDLDFNHHPDCEQYNETEYYRFCADCGDIEGSEHKDLWKSINTTGAWNMEKQCSEPWGFIWGKRDLEHLKKACATIMHEKDVDKWLDTPSPSFPKTPRKVIEFGDYEEIYLAMYSMGTGQFS